MKLRQLSAATDELRDALSWYRQRNPRAAELLWIRVQEARHSVMLFPEAAPLIGPGLRRFILSGFPYDMIYAVHDSEIVILAIAHHSRRPGYWRTRVNVPN